MNQPRKSYSVTVIGTGVMGKGIVQILAESDHVSSVNWIGRKLSSVESSLSSLNTQWERQVKRNKLDHSQAQDFIGKVCASEDYNSVVDSNLVIEAVAESMDAKKEIFKNISRLATGKTIIASNTSSLSITELSTCCPFPENVVGLHFFNPAPVMKLTPEFNT